jgi:hypothetical protein
VLDRELGEVEGAVGALLAREGASLNQRLRALKRPPIPLEAPEHAEVLPSSSDLRRAFDAFRGLPVAAPAAAERD